MIATAHLEVFTARELGNSSFLVADPDAGEAVVIDPLRDVDQYLTRAEGLGAKVGRVLDTHLHNDFVSGARELAKEAGSEIGPLADGKEIAVGRWRLRALHTPGHTPDHLSYLLTEARGRPLALFSGGALMVGSIARTDLFGPHLAVHLALEAFRTVQVRLRGLPDEVAVYPTHGAGSFCGSSSSRERQSTLGQERLTNPYLTTTELMPFLARALHQARYPDYYREMAAINSQGARLLGRRLPALKPLKPHQVETLMRERHAAVVDMRSGREYDQAHVPGSFNVGLSGPFSAWVGWVVERLRPIILVGGSQAQIVEAQRQLLRIGYDDQMGYLEGGVDAWQAAGLETRSFETAEIEDMATWILSAEPMTVLDVRDEDEWVHGHVPGSVHIYAPDVPHHAHELPRQAPIAVHCASGYRAGLAASLLEQAGFDRILHVVGEWSDWDRLHLATTVPG